MQFEQAPGAIIPHAGEEHGDGRRAGTGGHRAEQDVDARAVRGVVRTPGEPDVSPVDLQVPVGRYVLDHAYRKAKLGVEHDGAHHRTAEQALYDLERQAFFSEADWRILRFRPAVVLGRPQDIPRQVAAELRRRT